MPAECNNTKKKGVHLYQVNKINMLLNNREEWEGEIRTRGQVIGLLQTGGSNMRKVVGLFIRSTRGMPVARATGGVFCGKRRFYLMTFLLYTLRSLYKCQAGVELCQP